MIRTKFTLVAALAATVLVAADALADGPRGNGRKKRRNVETLRMAPPADGGGTNARGNITITHGRRGDDAVLHVKGLDRRDTYEVVDGETGDRIGTLRTNRRGIGTFDLTPGIGKRLLRADSAGGEDAEDVPAIVDVVDPDTGDTVLTGDTTGDLQALYGFATVGNATESATITMGSDPVSDSQFFAFSYFAEPIDDSWFAGVHEFYADTFDGGTLPLGKASVLDLAGLRFQVRNAQDEMVFRGTLPDVEAYSIEDPNYPEPTDPGGVWDEGTTRDPYAGAVPFDFDSWFQGGDPFSTFAMDGLFGGGARYAKTGRADDSTSEPVIEFTLWLETADGFEKAADLTPPEIYHPCDDWDDFDWGDDAWSDDWSWEWDWSGEWAWPSDPATGDDGTNSTAGTRRR